MGEKLSEIDFANKVEWEGGVYEAICEYGLSANDLADTNSNLYKLVSELDKVKTSFVQLIHDVEDLVERVIDEH